MDIEKIRRKAQRGEFQLTYHAHLERQEEGIEIAHIKETLMSGEILEDYPDDPRGHSCLVLGYSEGRAIHIVCGWTKTDWLLVITVYIPRPPKWTDPRTRRKGGE